MTQTHTTTVGMLLFPNLTQLDLTGPYEVFARMPDTVVTLVAETRAPVRSERGLTITPNTSFADTPQYDVLFVPGGIGVNAMMEHAPVLEFLRGQAEGARYITSVCTGALLLGAAGLLLGYPTGWRWICSRSWVPNLFTSVWSSIATESRVAESLPASISGWSWRRSCAGAR